jgi:ectoine hydroxylase-related dioxygenase (phytanoyl-CoA dioxygenase family)
MSWDTTKLPKITNDLAQCKDDLDKWGYCILADVITNEERERLLERLKEQAQFERDQGVAWLGSGGRGGQTWVGSTSGADVLPPWQGVRTLINKGRVFLDLVRNEKLAELNGHIFRNQPWCLASSNGVIIRKGAVPTVIHTDQGHVPFETPMPLITNTMICLTEFTPENGATRVTPGSHTRPAPRILFDEQLQDGVNPDPIDQIAVEAPPGAAILFEGRLWHSSGASTSSDVRYSVTAAYGMAFMRQHDNYPASLHDHVHESLTSEERELLGFRANPFGRIDPRFPGDRSNSDVSNPYIPELGAGLDNKAIPAADMAPVTTFSLPGVTHVPTN